MISRLTVKSKLVLLLAVAIGASVLIGLVGVLGLRATTTSIDEIGVVRLPSIVGLSMMKEGQNAVRAANRGVLGWESDFRTQEKFLEVLRQKNDIWARIDKGWNIYEPLPQTPEEALLWKQFVKEWGEWKNGDQIISDTILALSENRSTSKQHALFAELRRQLDADADKFTAAETTLWKIVELNADVGNISMQQGKADAASAHTVILIVGASAICVLMLLGGFIVPSILRQLGGDPLYVSQIASRIAAGDLNVRLETKQGDTGSMLMSISHMVQQLRKREQEFRAMVENSPDIIIRYDPRCRRVYVNPSLQALLGFSSEEVLGKTPENITPLLDAPAYMQMVRQAQETRREVQGEPAFLDAQGAIRWGHTRFVPEFGADGEVVSVLSITRDITALKTASWALEASEARMRLFFERQLVGMAITSPEKGWLQVNDKLCEMLGYTRDELLRLSWDEQTHPEDLAADLANFGRLQRGEIDSYTLEKRFVCKDGNIIFTNLAVGCVRRTDGTLDYVLVLMEDITLRKQTERALENSRNQLRGLIARSEQIREEERKNIARDVHDDLAQILTSLKLGLSLLAHKYGTDNAPLRDDVQQALQMTGQAISVARNIISALRPVELDMGIVAALKSVMERFALLSGIRCEVNIEEIWLPNDLAIALFRIVQEALTNIARHSGANNVVLSLLSEPDAYVLKVRDNGKGFDVSAIKPDSFGLIGMRERSLMLGGTLLIDSRAENGTELIVRIPQGDNCD